MFEWYVDRCGSKNGYQKDICVKGIGLHTQKMITVLILIVDIIGETYYDHLISENLLV
jgi:hypothetical protein